MKNKEYTVLSKGIYTVVEAARLAQVPSARISRWIGGYIRDGVSYPPLWRSELEPGSDELSFLSFADLMEARVIAAFYNHGVRIQTVRKAIEVAKSDFDLERPFSSEKFQTDGKGIFVDLQSVVEDDSGLMDIISNQRAFRNIIQPAFKDIDFLQNTAVRWWPIGKSKTIVVDPLRSMGRPINVENGVPVDSLIDALDYKIDKPPKKTDIKNVARLFDVKESDVTDATVFYKKYAA